MSLLANGIHWHPKAFPIINLIREAISGMSNPFFDHPILNSPYSRPERHWDLDEQGQPTQKIIDTRRRAEFITPIPKPKKRKAKQSEFVFNEGKGLSTDKQQYDTTSMIKEVRNHVDQWRRLENPSQWYVSPETAVTGSIQSDDKSREFLRSR
jgi:type III restriction enzyme